MNALLRIAAALAPLALVACASVPPALPTSSVSAEAVVEDLADEAVEEETVDNPRIPKLELSEEWLYGLLAGEIVVQRGGAGVAAETYLQLARETRDPRVAQRASEFAMFSGNVRQASEALALWIELDPDADSAREQLLIALLRAGKLAESQPLVEGMLARQPARAGAIFVQLARLLARQPDRVAAAKLVSDLAERYPELPEARFAHLAVAAEAGEQAEVDKEFARLAKIAPTWDLPLLWQVDRLRRHSVPSAIDFLQAQLQLRPAASLELNLTMVRLLASEKRYTDAQRHAEKALQQYPKQAELLNMAGLLAFQNGNLQLARRQLEAALQAGYADADTLRYTLGQLADEQKQPQQARHWYQQVGQGENYLPARLRLAQLDAADGNWQQAINDLQPLSNDANQLVRVVALQAQIAKNAGDRAQAMTLLNQGLQRQPRATELLYDRALLSELDGQFALAEKDLLQVLELVPDHVHALNALGYALSNHTTRYREALAYVEKAHQAAPDDPMILDSLGWVYYKLGKLEQALQYLQASYASMPDAEVAAHLGEVLWQSGRLDEARKLWAEARKKEPDHPVLRETLQRLQP
ncbi:tetratricopeptide repeat protein [Vogesella indigofera]|uniref:tetratricopeptide repeat protein n=1 Tax=Vogesella indigofera TaxID=45465 RepID=UPI00234F8364|nr:tetratricopeptide repeat protein [Vogesella indigofera]MDC7700892.1 tetratricopeptide repeat protein [Vogesella indigofera]